MVPAMRGIGYGQMIANASVISYYTCLIALAVYYLVSVSASPGSKVEHWFQLFGKGRCEDFSTEISRNLRNIISEDVRDVYGNPGINIHFPEYES